ncbi:MAG TPA: hypothetical protein PLI13_06355, partial [Paracoccus sp. (in: a-proteobacteria)]|nr:hypothetical protein [Paracoccus sp. (in: a-proteobacteria)]
GLRQESEVQAPRRAAVGHEQRVAGEQRIADLFLTDPAGTAGLSVAELAQRCDTSTTSVVRFIAETFETPAT